MEIDLSMQAIAEFLKVELNKRLAAIRRDVVAVRDTACYNSLPRDLSSFPLLKVYRTVDNFTNSDNTSQVTIGYCLSFPDEEKIPGILRWVAKNINALLRERAIAHSGCNPIIDFNESFRAEYRVMTFQGEPLYSLLQFNFQIKETNIYG